MSQKYLITSVYCPDEFADPQPMCAVIPVDEGYILYLIGKHNRVAGVPGLYLGEFEDCSAVYTTFPDEEALPEGLFELFQTAFNDSSYVLTDHDLSYEFLEGLDIIVSHEIPTVRFFGGRGDPIAYFRAFIEDTSIAFETCAIDLEDVFSKLADWQPDNDSSDNDN